MIDYKRVPSSVFRLTYVREDAPVAVTVLGRAIGYYIPAGLFSLDTAYVGEERLLVLRSLAPHEAPKATEPTTSSASPAGVVDSPNPVPGMSQAARDAVLRRVAKGSKS